VGWAICRLLGLKNGSRNPLASSQAAMVITTLIDSTKEGVLYNQETAITQLKQFQDPHWQETDISRVIERLLSVGVLTTSAHKKLISPTCPDGAAIVVNEEKMDQAKARLDNWIQKYADNRHVSLNAEKEFQYHQKEYKQWELEFINAKARFRQLLSRRKVA
jgi:DNA-directed RNA polymerase subunit F